jgi:hypothetical protein
VNDLLYKGRKDDVQRLGLALKKANVSEDKRRARCTLKESEEEKGGGGVMRIKREKEILHLRMMGMNWKGDLDRLVSSQPSNSRSEGNEVW